MLPRYFVTATDTGVGKTQVACALLSLMADAGLAPAAFKPYESGCEDLSAPADAVALKAAARTDDDLALICPHRFRFPLAPGVAARRLRQDPPFAVTLELFRAFDRRALVVEGAGGLLVPIDRRRDVIDLVAALKLPVILVARSGLGTLNHTGLSLQALAARKLRVRAVVLSRSTPTADPSERDNASLLAERHRVPVLGPVPYLRDPNRRRAAFRRALRSLVPGTLRP
ncbi:MAG TPA: dethiobiotin synthase [Myxococcaceae bacterium]|jgi:dethiobiotin synthetase